MKFSIRFTFILNFCILYSNRQYKFNYNIESLRIILEAEMKVLLKLLAKIVGRISNKRWCRITISMYLGV